MSSYSLFQSLATCDAQTLAKAAAGSCAITAVFFVLSRRRSSLPLPPGPPPKLLLGNLLDLPPANSAPWHKWNEWHESYGQKLLPLTPTRLWLTALCHFTQATLFMWKCSDNISLFSALMRHARSFSSNVAQPTQIGRFSRWRTCEFTSRRIELSLIFP